MRVVPPLFLLPLLGGCAIADVAQTAVKVATIPVRLVSAGLDAATTSQSEADEKRGRDLRRLEEQQGTIARLMLERCQAGTALPSDKCPTEPPR